MNKTNQTTLCQLELTNDLKKAFLVSCREGTNSDLPTNLEGLTSEELESLWLDEFRYANYPQKIYNFKDSSGQYLFPHKYYEIWGESESLGLVALAKYGLQSIDLLTSEGKVLYEDANDVTFQSSGLMVIQKQNMQDWAAYFYKEDGVITELFMLKEMLFEEITFKNGEFDNGGEIIRLSDLNITLH